MSEKKQSESRMSATIMMPQQLDETIRGMCSDAMAQAVNALAAKYGFDEEEASRFLELDSVKIARKRGPSPKKADEKPSGKAKKMTKSKKEDEEKPKAKRAPTGYLLYSKDARQEVKEELLARLGEDEKLKPQDVVTVLAAKWKNLSDEE